MKCPFSNSEKVAFGPKTYYCFVSDFYLHWQYKMSTILNALLVLALACLLDVVVSKIVWGTVVTSPPQLSTGDVG